MDAGWEIVREAMQEPVYDRLVESVLTVDVNRLRVVIPHPGFGESTSGPTNAIPFVFAHYLAERLGCAVDDGIVQAARVGRTALNRFERFLWQPSFKGDVEAGANYIIVDDVVTLGATFATSASHIVRNGGSVCAATALAHRDGRHQQFPIRWETVVGLEAIYGAGLRPYWKEAIGHDAQISQRLRAFFCGIGGASVKLREPEPGSHFYTDLEIASIKQRRVGVDAAARRVVKRAGVQIDPRIAAAKAARASVVA